MNRDLGSDDFSGGDPPQGYALSGKIMLSAIVILFAVVIFMVCLHLYARWYLLRARRRSLRSRRRRSTHLVFYVDANNLSNTVTVPNRGLDPSLLNSLPIFVYSSKTHPDGLECAVCLSEFEDNEKGRLLPKCNHSFHIECIDMWFHSHSTCPLCRSPVEPGPVSEHMEEVNASVGEPVETEADSSSGLCSTCQHEEEHVGQGRSSSSAGTSSFGRRRKPLELVGVSIEVPRRNESFGRSDDEFGTESRASQSFKSPGSRLLSLKRILSRGLSPSSGSSVNRGSVTESDIERGIDDTQQTQAR